MLVQLHQALALDQEFVIGPADAVLECPDREQDVLRTEREAAVMSAGVQVGLAVVAHRVPVYASPFPLATLVRFPRVLDEGFETLLEETRALRSSAGPALRAGGWLAQQVALVFGDGERTCARVLPPFSWQECWMPEPEYLLDIVEVSD